MARLISAAQLKKALGPEVDRLVEDMTKAVNQAPDGAVIVGSEYQGQDRLARFRQTVYEKAVQVRADAGAWIETLDSLTSSNPIFVAPRAGTWIQTGQPRAELPPGRRRRVWTVSAAWSIRRRL